MNINWQETKGKYPKVYWEWKIWYAKNKNGGYYDVDERYNNICYCDLEKFFGYNEIIIRYKYFEKTGLNSYIIYNKKLAKIIRENTKHTNYDICKIAALEKSFEVVEYMIKLESL